MQQLICHPDTPAVNVEAVEACAERLESGRIQFRFHIDSSLNALALGKAKPPERTDGLWKSTCFEAFLRCSRDGDYLEYNFAPSGQWAAYAFTDYRLGGTDLRMDQAPEISLDAGERRFAMKAEVVLPTDWCDIAIELNLTAVVEETDGTKSYWALAHPSGRPDFHHKDCFALKVEAPRRP